MPISGDKKREPNNENQISISKLQIVKKTNFKKQTYQILKTKTNSIQTLTNIQKRTTTFKLQTANVPEKLPTLNKTLAKCPTKKPTNFQSEAYQI